MNQTPHVLAINAVVRTTGARVYYEVRGEGPGVLLAGCPMDATAFAPLADLLAVDHTVITTDPRGINRSSVDDPDVARQLDGTTCPVGAFRGSAQVLGDLTRVVGVVEEVTGGQAVGARD